MLVRIHVGPADDFKDPSPARPLTSAEVSRWKVCDVFGTVQPKCLAAEYPAVPSWAKCQRGVRLGTCETMGRLRLYLRRL